MTDLIFSFLIIIISLVMVLSYFNVTSTNVDMYNLNFQIMNSMTQTPINSLNDIEIREYFINGKIKNIENTIAQQVSEFYYNNNLNDAKNLTSFFISNYNQDNLNFEINLYNNSNKIQLYQKLNRAYVNYEDAKISSATSRSVLGFVNQFESYGPYYLEVLIWS